MSAEKRGVATVGLHRCDGRYLTPHAGRLPRVPFFRRHPGWPVPSLDVIPDGPQGRAGIQKGAPQVPATAHVDSARGKPLQPSRWIPGSAYGGPGMTSKSKTSSQTVRSLLLPSSRTSHPLLSTSPRPAHSSSTPPGRPLSFDVIPDGAQRRAGIQTGTSPVPAPPARTRA